MKRSFVLLLMCLFILTGCGEVLKETSGGGSGSSPAAPVRRGEINRPFTVAGGIISFTDVVATAGIVQIEYGTGSTPNVAIRFMDTSYAGKSLMVGINYNGYISWSVLASDLPNCFVVWDGDAVSNTGNIVYGPTATQNALDPANKDNFIEVLVDGVIIEKYWLNDFLIN